jgi:hypothetical protein
MTNYTFYTFGLHFLSPFSFRFFLSTFSFMYMASKCLMGHDDNVWLVLKASAHVSLKYYISVREQPCSLFCKWRQVERDMFVLSRGRQEYEVGGTRRTQKGKEGYLWGGWHSLNLSRQAFRQHTVLRIAKWNSTRERAEVDDRKES